jgi:hypothetical protein
MSYTINRFNGDQIAIVPDGTINTVTDITLIGKNYAGYGEKQNENFVFLLDNFSKTSPPTKPLDGQLWYNSTTGALKINVYDGANWKSLAVNNVTTDANRIPPSSVTAGDMWYDQVTNQLKIFNGTSYTLVGPESVYGYGQTQMHSVKIKDTVNNDHPVQFGYSNGNIIFAISNDADFSPSIAISGFATIYQGITVNSNMKYNGTATNADRLGTNLPSFYAPISNPEFPTVVKIVDAGLQVGSTLNIFNSVTNIPTVKNITGSNMSFQTTTGGVTNTPLTLLGNNVLPGTNATTDLGSSVLAFKNLYAGYVYSTAQKSDSLSLGGTYVTATTASASNTIVARDVSSDIRARKFIGKADSAINADFATQAAQADLASVANVANFVEWYNVNGKPINFVFNDNNTTAWNINIAGSSVGTHTGPVVGNVTGNLSGNSSGQHTGAVLGNVTGDVTGNTFGVHTGNVNGNVVGNTTGTHTGPVVGNVTGNVTGNLTGNATGNLTGNVTGNLTGNVTGTIHTATNYFAGNLLGNVTGNVTGNTSGFHTGNVSGNVTGNLTGNVTGNITGNSAGTHTGPVVGNVTGILTGNSFGIHTGAVTGDVTGSVYAQNGRIFLSNGSASSPSIAFWNDGAIDTGFYWGGDGYINITNNGQYSGQFRPGGGLSLLGSVTAPTFTGNLTGNASGSSAYIINSGTISAETNGVAEPGQALTLRSVYNNGYPAQYGNVITLGGAGGGELLIGWSGSTGSHADNYIRSRRDTGTTWSPWAKILTDTNFGATLATVASTGSYTDLSNKPTIPAPTASPRAQLQNIVKTIVGTIDMYLSSSSGSGYTSGYVGASVGGGWSSSTSYNRTTAATYVGGGTGSVTLTVDLAGFLGLSTNPADLTWKGNYDLNVGASLTRITDNRIVYYGMGQQQWAVAVAPITADSNSPFWGRFNITLTIGSGDHWYHGTNIQAGWIGIGSRINNVYSP